MVIHSAGSDYKELDKLGLDTRSWERRLKQPAEEYPSFASLGGIGKTHIIVGGLHLSV
jgi:hypothetical protein